MLQTWARLPQAGFTVGKRQTQGWQSPAETLFTAQVVHLVWKSLAAALDNELKNVDYILDVDWTAELVTKKGGRLACSRVETLCTSQACVPQADMGSSVCWCWRRGCSTALEGCGHAYSAAGTVQSAIEDRPGSGEDRPVPN